MTEEFTIVDTCSGLKDLATALEKKTVIACDLEADSMYHYREKVCLLQMAAEQMTFVIDPLAVGQMTALQPLFLNPDIRKVFHGADYDVRSLFRDFNIEIQNLFDTEIACRFLGMRSSGLDAVLKKMFDLSLNKKFQRSDWSIRPLPDDMLQYAAQDTAHLIELSKILLERLEETGRMEWVAEECEILSKVRPAASENQPLYMKFKGAGRLSRQKLAVLEGLLEFRQQLARKKDRPLFKIVGNDALMKLVAAMPESLKDLEKTRILSKKQISLFGAGMVRIVRERLQIPLKDLPVYPKNKPPRMEPSVPRRMKAIKEWRDAKAKTLKIAPSLLFSKTQMTAIARTRPLRFRDLNAITEIRRWQTREFGREIIQVVKKTA